MYCRLLCLSDWLTLSLILQADNKLTSIWFLCSVYGGSVCCGRELRRLSALGWEQVFIIHLLLVPTDASVTPPSTLCLKCASVSCMEFVCAPEWRRILAPAKRIYEQTSQPFHTIQKHSCIINIPYKSTHSMGGRWCVLAPPSHSGGHQCLVKVVRPACVALYASLASQTALIQIWILRTVHEAN